MRRTEIVEAVNRVLGAMKDSGMTELFEILLGHGGRDVDKKKVLPAFGRYNDLSKGFGAAERQIISDLGLDGLHRTEFWTALMVDDDLQNADNYAVSQSIRFAEQHLPKILKLLSRETDTAASGAKEEGEELKEDLALLSVIVIEEVQLSTPARLVLVLESIAGLYDACAEILGEIDADLAVSACDSGSDKSFDFLGLAKIVDCVKEVLLSFWDKVIYFREDKTGRKLELIADSLPILERIAEMRESDSIDPSRAEIIKRLVIDSVSKFSEAGVTIPEIEDFTYYNPRQLMKPEPKLLSAGQEPDQRPPEPDRKGAPPQEIDDPEFLAYMKKMADEFREVRQRKSEQPSAKDSKDETDEKPNKPSGGYVQ